MFQNNIIRFINSITLNIYIYIHFRVLTFAKNPLTWIILRLIKLICSYSAAISVVLYDIDVWLASILY